MFVRELTAFSVCDGKLAVVESHTELWRDDLSLVERIKLAYGECTINANGKLLQVG